MPRKIDRAEFVISGVGPRDFPVDGRAEVALVGRSNVGKSTLINALVRKDIARTSATPGKTRQVNIYRIQQLPAAPFYLMDLPGYGHTSGGEKARDEFSAIVGTYFDSRRPMGDGGAGPSRDVLAGCILAIDSRHPGLASDIDALRWLASMGAPTLVVATKIDKLSQSERAKLRRACEAAFGQTPLTVSALKGDGLDELWKRIREWTGA
jgi:GTP-binding protein